MTRAARPADLVRRVVGDRAARCALAAARLAVRYAAPMCRSIRQLRRADDDGPATTGEASAAALQYVRKVSGLRAPPARHRAAFDAAVAEVAAATERLLAAIGTDVTEGPDPFADPVQRRAILAARPGPRPRRAPRASRAAAEATAATRPAPAEGPP